MTRFPSRTLCSAITLALFPLAATAQDNADTISPIEMEVTGQRGGQARALTDQYNAGNSRNVISADQAGRFPDLNAAESMRRVPGVTVQREVTGGDGRYISIRGLDSGLNNTQVNGVNASQPEKENRRVPLDMIQTSALSKITIHKTLTPDLESDGIGGAVELETATAFDFAGPVAELTLRAYHQELSGEVDPIAEGTFARRFGDDQQFGVLVSLAYLDRSTRGYVFYNDEDQVYLIEDEPGSGVTPLQFHLTRYEDQRENVSGNVAFNWALSDTTDLVFKASYNRLYDEELSHALYFDHEEDYDDDGMLPMDEGGTANVFNQYEETELTQQVYSLSGTTYAGDFTFRYGFGYSSALREEPFDNEVAFEYGLESSLYAYTRDGSFPVPNLTASDLAGLADPDNYSLGYNDIDIDDSKNERQSFRFDIDYDVAGDSLQTISAGLKFERSEKTLFEGNVMELSGDLSMTEFGVGPLIDVSDAGAPYAPFLSLAPRNLMDWRNYSQSLIDNDPENFENEYVEDDGIPLDEDSYSSDEDILAVYVMAKAVFGDLDIIGGLRIDHTSVESDNYEILELEDETLFGKVTGKGEYTSVLPRVQANYHLDDETIIRAAYYTSIARPEPLFISGAIEVEEDDGEVEVTVGNPDLKPAYAHNFDLSVERYFRNVGLVSAGVYTKHIKHFIFSGIAPETEGDIERFANDPRLAGKDIDSVTTYTNGEDATLYGLELNVVQNFTDLPGLWSGLGVYANATIQRSEAETGLEDVGEIDFFYAPEFFYTAALTYQQDNLEGTLAWSWRDSQNLRFSSYDTLIVEESYGSLDLRLSYQPRDNITLSLSGVDILNDGSDPVIDERYGTGSPYLEGATYTGRSVTAGINVKF